MTLDHVKISYTLFAVVFILLGILFYQNQTLRIATSATGTVTTQSPFNASTTATLASITVGSAPATDNVIGTITQISANSIQIKDQVTGQTDSVAIGTDTKIQIAGKIKDVAIQQSELDAYNAQVALLMKDPVKNKAALAAMKIPTTQEVTPATLVDLVVGDQVLVVASSVDAKGVYQASVITNSR